MRHLIVIAVLLLVSAGCQREDVVGAEGATVGDLEMTGKAVRLVLLDERAMINFDRIEGRVRVIEARYADGTEVTFDLEPLSRSTSHVTVQVGHFGNAEQSRRLLEAVKAQVREIKDAEVRSRALANPPAAPE